MLLKMYQNATNPISTNNIEDMYSNQCVGKTKECDMMLINACCEIINNHLKKITISVNIFSLVDKSLFVYLMSRCEKKERA